MPSNDNAEESSSCESSSDDKEDRSEILDYNYEENEESEEDD
jgi:hypothetical protein